MMRADIEDARIRRARSSPFREIVAAARAEHLLCDLLVDRIGAQSQKNALVLERDRPLEERRDEFARLQPAPSPGAAETFDAPAFRNGTDYAPAERLDRAHLTAFSSASVAYQRLQTASAAGTSDVHRTGF